MPDKLLTLGAALRVEELPEYCDWLIAGARDLEIQDTARAEVLDGDHRVVVQQIRQTLNDYTGRLGVHGPFSSLTLLAHDPAIAEVVQRRFRQALAIVQEIGATHMVIHSPFQYMGSPFLPHSPAHGQADQFELIHRVLDDIVPIAEAANCTLVIEDILDTNSGPLLALIRSFNSEYVRLSIDTGHAYIAHLRGGPTPDQWVRDGGELLAHLHLQDTDGQVDRHWTPGAGHINWHALFEALYSLEQEPRMIIEIRDKTAIGRAAEWFAAQGYAK